ncbi:hypothetical protein ACFL35_10420 [Candidatus Riflebacteria bacterium]
MISRETLGSVLQVSYWQPGYKEKWLCFPRFKFKPQKAVQLEPMSIFLFSISSSGKLDYISDYYHKINSKQLQIFIDRDKIIPSRGTNNVFPMVENQFGYLNCVEWSVIAKNKVCLAIPLNRLDNYLNFIKLRYSPKSRRNRAYLFLYDGISRRRKNKFLKIFSRLGMEKRIITWDIDRLGEPPRRTIFLCSHITYVHNSSGRSENFIKSLIDFAQKKGNLIFLQQRMFELEDNPYFGLSQVVLSQDTSIPLAIKNKKTNVNCFVVGGLFFEKEQFPSPYETQIDKKQKFFKPFSNSSPCAFISLGKNQRVVFLGHFPWQFFPELAGLKIFRKSLWFTHSSKKLWQLILKSMESNPRLNDSKVKAFLTELLNTSNLPSYPG